MKTNYQKCSTKESQNGKQKQETSTFGKVIGGPLNMRCQTSKKSDVMKVLKEGTRVEIVKGYPLWYKVKVGEDVGFCMSEFIEVEKVGE